MKRLDLLALPLLVVYFLTFFTHRTSAYLFTQTQATPVLAAVAGAMVVVYLLPFLLRRLRIAPIVQTATVVVLGVVLAGGLMVMQIAVRHSTKPYLYIHDGAVQTEDAIAALRSGENPYAIDYRMGMFGAFPDGFSEATRPNPAWSHFVYLPLGVVIGIPAAIASHALIGWFDFRFVTLPFFVLLVVCGSLLARTPERRILTLMLLLLNPLFVPFVASGYNDTIFLGLIALSALMLQRQRFFWSAAVFGAALAAKQSAWLMIPFYTAHVWFSAATERWRTTVRRLIPTLVLAAVTLVPFIAWSPRDFIDDTIRYPSGSAMYSYPISGIGFAEFMLENGVIRSQWDRYPFWILQLATCGPLLVVLVRWQRLRPTINRMLASFAAFALVFWFFSRFFNDSYLGVISVAGALCFASWPDQPASRATADS